MGFVRRLSLGSCHGRLLLRKQSRRVSVSCWAEGHSASQAPSSSVSVPLHLQQGELSLVSEALGMMLFTVHHLLLSSWTLLHTWPAHSPSHALDSYLPFRSESWSLQPQIALQQTDGSSGAWIWKPLKARSKGEQAYPICSGDRLLLQSRKAGGQTMGNFCGLILDQHLQLLL